MCVRARARALLHTRVLLHAHGFVCVHLFNLNIRVFSCGVNVDVIITHWTCDDAVN